MVAHHHARGMAYLDITDARLDQTLKLIVKQLCLFFITLFNQALSAWDTRSVTDASYLFDHSIVDQDIADWDTARVCRFVASCGADAAQCRALGETGVRPPWSRAGRGEEPEKKVTRLSGG